jgi:outer membrane protein assembly factor BamB
MVGSTPFIRNNTIYVSSGAGYLDALDTKNGTRIWEYNNHGQGVFSTPAIIGDLVYFTDKDGYLYALYEFLI